MTACIDIRGRLVTYSRWGDGPPTLLLSPAQAPNEGRWLSLLPWLAEHMAAYVIELPDTNHCETLLGLLDYLGIKQANLVFTEACAETALLFAARNPRRTGLVVLAANNSSDAKMRANVLLDHLGRRPVLPFGW